MRSLRDAVCVGVWPVLACYTLRSIDLAGNIATGCLISGRYFCVLLLSSVQPAQSGNVIKEIRRYRFYPVYPVHPCLMMLFLCVPLRSLW